MVGDSAGGIMTRDDGVANRRKFTGLCKSSGLEKSVDGAHLAGVGDPLDTKDGPSNRQFDRELSPSRISAMGNHVVSQS